MRADHRKEPKRSPPQRPFYAIRAGETTMFPFIPIFFVAWLLGLTPTPTTPAATTTSVVQPPGSLQPPPVCHHCRARSLR
jgi:hypothetical protein